MTLDTNSAAPGAGAPTATLPDLDALRAELTGRLLTSDESDWAILSAPWNLAVRAQPAAVLLAGSAGDVSTIVRYARTHGLAVSPQAGGHGATTAVDRTIVVRTSGLTDIWIDSAARVARLGAGVRWGALQAALDGTGLTGLVGSNPDVSVAGFVLQGGYSWFTREFGTGAGSLRAAEVVDVDGEREWIDDHRDPETMWGLRGGGGRFAAVTAIEIDLFPAESLAGGRLMFPAGDAVAVLDAVAVATAAAPQHVSLWAGLLRFPDLPVLPPQLRGQEFCVVDSVTTRGIDALEFVLGPVRSAGTVVHDTVRERTASEISAICEEPVEPTPALQLGIPLTGMSEEVREIVLDGFSHRALTQVQLRDLGDSPTRRDGVASRVDSRFVLMALAITPFPEAEAAARAAMERLAARLAPWTAGHVLPSFVAPWGSLAESCDPDPLARLAALTARRDPVDLFVASLPL